VEHAFEEIDPGGMQWLRIPPKRGTQCGQTKAWPDREDQLLIILLEAADFDWSLKTPRIKPSGCSF
jgi:hypothetical protein